MTSQLPRSAFGSLGVRTPLCLPGQRVGVMGGSFNPPHEGHRIAAEAAVRRLALDQLWWLVTPGNPLKAGDSPSLESRVELIRPFARGPCMRIATFERELGTPYTAATLAFLTRRHPAVHFVWIMGADNLASFDRWQRWRAIAETMPIAVVDRPGWRHLALASEAAKALARYRIAEAKAPLLPLLKPPAWLLLTTKLSPLSSTALRAAKSDPEARYKISL